MSVPHAIVEKDPNVTFLSQQAYNNPAMSEHNSAPIPISPNRATAEAI